MNGIIVEDTRNQVAKHRLLNDMLKAKGFAVIRSKLLVGDYTRLDDMRVCVDTKKDIDEVAGNICGKQHERFREECIRARDNFIQLVILIEEMPPNGELEQWVSEKKRKGGKDRKAIGKTLKKAMETMSDKYGVRFEFTTRENCANRIIELLSLEIDNLNA